MTAIVLVLIVVGFVYVGVYGWIFWDMWDRHKKRMAQFDRMIETVEEINRLIDKRNGVRP